jgi:hypothetical protein
MLQFDSEDRGGKKIIVEFNFVGTSPVGEDEMLQILSDMQCHDSAACVLHSVLYTTGTWCYKKSSVCRSSIISPPPPPSQQGVMLYVRHVTC